MGPQDLGQHWIYHNMDWLLLSVEIIIFSVETFKHHGMRHFIQNKVIFSFKNHTISLVLLNVVPVCRFLFTIILFGSLTVCLAIVS